MGALILYVVQTNIVIIPTQERATQFALILTDQVRWTKIVDVETLFVALENSVCVLQMDLQAHANQVALQEDSPRTHLADVKTKSAWHLQTSVQSLIRLEDATQLVAQTDQNQHSAVAMTQ